MYSAGRTSLSRIPASITAGKSTRCVYSTLLVPSVASLITSNAFIKSQSATLSRHIRAGQSVRFFTFTPAGWNSETKDETSNGQQKNTVIVEEQSPEVEQGTPVGDVLSRDTEAVESAPEVIKAVAQKHEQQTEMAAKEQHTKEEFEQIQDWPTTEAEQQGTPVPEVLQRDGHFQATDSARGSALGEINGTTQKTTLHESEVIQRNEVSQDLPPEDAKSSEIPSRPKEPVLAGVASHLINLRFSGLSLEEYIEITGAEELSSIRDDVLAKKRALSEAETEAANRKNPNERWPHDPHWQAVQARKAKEFVLPGAEDPIVSHLVNLIMRDGKKQRAQRIVAEAFVIVRMRLQDDPVKILRHVIEQTMPLVKIKKVKSGAKSFSVPKALTARQRHRKALDWILEEAEKRPSPSFGVRLGDALVAVRRAVDTGAALEKKNAIHKIAIENRAYINARF
ncbi:ribosomal protein S7 domain-containing protein [Lipomyces kononenkoae]|uniref:Ribosomal protein S7 domain-containing protein n=1 Tax=Lipomyces kononenkoae TaxID=34357 RepID=A0ACC3T7P2_LIPKO